MQIQIHEASALHFPKQEWLWLRESVSLPTNAPDFFVWGTFVNQKIWAWTTSGSDFANKDLKTKIPVLLLSSENELEAYGLYLKTVFHFNSPQRNNDAEWVIALRMLKDRFQVDLANQSLPLHWAEALKYSGLEPHLGVLSTRQRFQFLNFEELKFLFDRKWDLSVFEILETWEPELRKAFLDAIGKWNISSQNAKDAAAQVFLLMKKNSLKTTIQILTSSFSSPEEFRTSLFRTAQPEFAALSQKRVEQLRQMAVPPRTIVFGDPEFEKDLLKITHTPRKLHEFECFRDWVTDPETLARIKTLLEIYQ